ncbi:hypothetical protein KL930_001727 [Ogataea haglerorum]|uniref:Letm1 RBD domain-containing protein n=1 Tax=Ogataea haglerorum TaxID=1937702 RepID=A0ABQ7RKB7_9ASCO|nr:uncharacterized protein KL911_001668 [Ogataea haglerorum]KAG7698065.1 hypothetical protein KL915_001782 [Ogataea haglerorum]KAG7699641.1 hypothetical protein KL951_001358 [Ogataea haglerorum]KAG7708287.1 hypothetical protein KL914_002013 [Ogataea haglerorum]KAG7710686.1 hypothetical protein KL950_001599 [Ogataea haglerorum]KAG7721307.1 hypothetical protein KL913_001043 [Ogataea haglerorum]
MKRVSHSVPVFVQRRSIVSSVPPLHLIQTRKSITNQVLLEKSYSGVRLKAVVLFRLAKVYLKFFKEGMGSIWTNYKDLRSEVYSRNLFLVVNGLAANDMGTGDARDQKLYLKNSSLPQVVDELATAVSCLENSGSLDLSREQIKISRAQFQTMLRTRGDVFKLPLFALLFGIFEEFSLPLYYIFPGLMPFTCVFPAFMKTYYGRSIKAQRRLAELRKERTFDEIAVQNPFTMTEEELRSVCDLIKVGAPFSSADGLRAQLLQKYKELIVDTHLLLRDGGVDKLDRLEVFFTCLDRGLVDWEQVLYQLKDREKTLYESLDETLMRERLRAHLERFGKHGYNVGLVGLF